MLPRCGFVPPLLALAIATTTPATALQFHGRIWPATGEATARAEIRLLRGLAQSVVYQQDHGAE